MQLKRTHKNMSKLIELARECNAYNGSHEWSQFYTFDEIDDVLAGMKPSEILTKVLYGEIPDGIDWSTARIRLDALGNIEITSVYQIK